MPDLLVPIKEEVLTDYSMGCLLGFVLGLLMCPFVAALVINAAYHLVTWDT